MDRKISDSVHRVPTPGRLSFGVFASIELGGLKMLLLPNLSGYCAYFAHFAYFETIEKGATPFDPRWNVSPCHAVRAAHEWSTKLQKPLVRTIEANLQRRG